MSKKNNGHDVDLKLIRDLIGVMDKGKLSKLQIKDKAGFEIVLEKEGHLLASSAVSHHERHHPPVLSHPHELPPLHHSSIQEKAGHFVTSPMVGTFYRSPSPDDPAFVSIGDVVEENTVICIIEAMKVMNEVKAGKSGVVKEILIDNIQPVEFGTKLFRIE